MTVVCGLLLVCLQEERMVLESRQSWLSRRSRPSIQILGGACGATQELRIYWRLGQGLGIEDV